MKEFLSTDELCEYLNVSKSYVYKLSFNNKLPKFSPGGKRIWFKLSDIHIFLSNGRVASQDELNAEAELTIYKNKKK
jgi:excisionase family DNA binding protein